MQTVLGDGKIVEKRRKNNGFGYVERKEKNEMVWNENQSKQDEIKNKNVYKMFTKFVMIKMFTKFLINKFVQN